MHPVNEIINTMLMPFVCLLAIEVITMTELKQAKGE